jgi:hypothetical protein
MMAWIWVKPKLRAMIHPIPVAVLGVAVVHTTYVSNWSTFDIIAMYVLLFLISDGFKKW